MKTKTVTNIFHSNFGVFSHVAFRQNPTSFGVSCLHSEQERRREQSREECVARQLRRCFVIFDNDEHDTDIVIVDSDIDAETERRWRDDHAAERRCRR
jgi:hypothetical protein